MFLLVCSQTVFASMSTPPVAKTTTVETQVLTKHTTVDAKSVHVVIKEVKPATTIVAKKQPVKKVVTVKAKTKVNKTDLTPVVAKPVEVVKSVKKPAKQATVTVAKSSVGKASYYHQKFHGRTTANGEKFNNNAYTAAHKTLPMGTMVRVTNIKTNQSVVVRINDRGPYVKGREIDLSKRAAIEIGMVGQGVAVVRYEVVEKEKRG